MPVKKVSGEPAASAAKSSPASSNKKHDCCFTEECGASSVRGMYASDFGRKILWTMVGILLLYGVVFLGTLIRNNLQKYYFIGKADRQPRMITVEAVGTVTAQPDIAVTTMGMSAEGATVAEAQEKNTVVMNTLIDRLKALGISSDDLQTRNYSVYPQYDYIENEGQILRGYMVSQDVRVKIRDLSQSNQVLALAGEVGATNVGGLEFTIDDRDVYLAQAREEALEKIQTKIVTLSKSLGVNPIAVAGYNEFEQGGGPVPMFRELSLDSGVGALPTIESGTTDVVMNVQVTFEIR